MSKLLDRHGKYKYDDAAPDEDEPRHLDLSEKREERQFGANSNLFESATGATF